jgi:hypothetical protein
MPVSRYFTLPILETDSCTVSNVSLTDSDVPVEPIHLSSSGSTSIRVYDLSSTAPYPLVYTCSHACTVCTPRKDDRVLEVVVDDRECRSTYRDKTRRDRLTLAQLYPRMRVLQLKSTPSKSTLLGLSRAVHLRVVVAAELVQEVYRELPSSLSTLEVWGVRGTLSNPTRRLLKVESLSCALDTVETCMSLVHLPSLKSVETVGQTRAKGARLLRGADFSHLHKASLSFLYLLDKVPAMSSLRTLVVDCKPIPTSRIQAPDLKVLDVEDLGNGLERLEGIGQVLRRDVETILLFSSDPLALLKSCTYLTPRSLTFTYVSSLDFKEVDLSLVPSSVTRIDLVLPSLVSHSIKASVSLTRTG